MRLQRPGLLFHQYVSFLNHQVAIECSLEIFAEDLVVGIQDLGGAGLSCATSELASGGYGGMKVQLDKVPLRDPSLSPEEILMSESQERMCAIVEPSKIERFLEICKKWDVTVTVIGEVTDGNHLEITWNGELIVDVVAGIGTSTVWEFT